MTRRRTLILFVIMVFIAITTAILVLKEPSWEPNLNIWLRCDEGVSGTLSIIPLQPDCKGRLVKESFDVEAACENDPLPYSPYRRRTDLLFTFKRKSGEVTELTSEYGPDIQTERDNGFSVIDLFPLITL